MITNFCAENYRSISERVELSFAASMGIKDTEDEGYTVINGQNILNAMAIFGANSSGKSNVFKAIGRMRSLIVQSVRLNDNESLNYDPFLLSDSPLRPTRFELSFVDGTDRFTYGLACR